MFRFDAERTHLAVDPTAIIALYQSVNTAQVAQPGVPTASARAVIVGHRLPDGFDVIIGLQLTNDERHLVFTHDLGQLDRAGARQAAKEALAFAESMGFFMENVSWRELDPAARRERFQALKVFEPPPQKSRSEAKLVVDPRTRLARLLAQL